MRFHGLLVFALFVAVLPVAASESTVLIPTLYSGPGAFGSTWWSDVVINNHASAPFSAPGVEFGVLCFIPEGCQSQAIPAGEFGVIVGPRPANGLLLRADSAVLSRLAFRSRFGQGRNYFTNGTELPIARETDFVREAIHFPYVTLYLTPEPVRSTLRVYGPDALPGTTVRVELRSWTSLSGTPTKTLVLQLDVPPQPDGLVVFPAYAQISLQQLFPFAEVGGSSFNVSVVPVPSPNGEIPRIWAFISTTDNNSQQVSVQTPQ